MGLFKRLFALELVQMVTLIRWRVARQRGVFAADPAAMARLAALSQVELGFLLILPFLAAAMARGLG